jgi:hypothetical protein
MIGCRRRRGRALTLPGGKKERLQGVEELLALGWLLDLLD